MDTLIEMAVADLKRTIDNVERLKLDLNRDFPNDATGKARQWGLEWQETIQQQSRTLMFDYSLLPRSDEEYKACLEAIEVTIPLLEGSRYAQIQRDRIKDLREFYEVSKTLTSLPCS
ncbi:MAG: hypothetical protein AABX07_03170 [Nanoarchaeota archaeon]